MEILLTDPDLLAAYVNDFFTHIVPLPKQDDAVAYQRASFPEMPTGGSGNSAVNLSDVRPDQRWIVADQMEAAGLFSGKTLVIE